MFIVFEGVDGAGKSTQARLLYNFLKNRVKKLILTKYPSKGPVGKLIKKELLCKKTSSEVDSFLFLADMFEQDEEVIKPLVKKGYSIISDRYYPSFIAYQKSQGFNTKLLKDFYNRLTKPDLVFILKCSPLVCFKRGKKKRSKYEKLSFLKKVSREYDKIKSLLSCKVVMLDSSKSVKELHDVIIKEVKML